jgi:hypothetical protein
MTPPNDPPADTSRAPAPRRRLRALARRHRFATFLVTLLALTLLLRLVWGWYAARQLAAALDALRRQGHPTAENEVVTESIPASENAWPLYAKAIGAMKPGVDSPRYSNLEFPPYAPYGAQWETLAAVSEAAHAPAFAAARQARHLPRSQFPLTATLSAGWNRPEWNAARRLASNLADGAEYAHLRGDDAEAVGRLLDTLHLGRSLRQDPTIVGQLVSVGVQALAADTVQRVAPTMRLDAEASAKPATRDQARELIKALLDEKDSRTWFARALSRERVVMLDALYTEADGTWALRPLADRTALRWTRAFDTLIDTAERLNAAQARKVAGALQEPERPEPLTAALTSPHAPEFVRYSRWFESFGPDNLARAIEQFHRASAERRATAVIVAARLYRQDHGRWPDDAAELVPKFLDALPADPFRGDDGAIGYVLMKGALPDGGDRPLVYFEVGPSSEGSIDTEPMYGWQVDHTLRIGRGRYEGRQYRDVSYWLPKSRRFDEALKASTQAVGNDPDEPDAPGDDAKDKDAPERPPEQ